MKPEIKTLGRVVGIGLFLWIATYFVTPLDLFGLVFLALILGVMFSDFI